MILQGEVMKYVSLLLNDEIIAQIPVDKNVSSSFIMQLDQMLSDGGILPDDAELCVTEDI
jgi:hypothetical protein